MLIDNMADVRRITTMLRSSECNMQDFHVSATYGALMDPAVVASKYVMSSSNSEPRHVDVLVVGGGLSGLVICQRLHRWHAEWLLLEARPVLGGRLCNAPNRPIDMGGAWIWPQHQPKIRALVQELGIPIFPQPDDPTSFRLQGGAVTIIHKLAETLPHERIQLNAAVGICRLDHSNEANQRVLVETTSGHRIVARTVVWAVPPQMLSKHVIFDPPLSSSKQSAIGTSHTWMAGVTKVALMYSKRFWDYDHSNMGFPWGTGPAFQVYDSSTTMDETVSGALTFFALIRGDLSTSRDDDTVARQVADQLAWVWKTYYDRSDLAQHVASYVSYHVQRWPLEDYISEDSSPTRVQPHPEPNKALSTMEWNGALLFAGSETDQESPGVMEGAVGAAHRVLSSWQEMQSLRG